MRVLLLAVIAMSCLYSASAAQAEASHILVADEGKAKELLETIKAAANQAAEFADQAKAHSTCPSGKSGGSLGKFGQGQMVPEFDAVIFDPATEIGTVYGPVKTQFGFHLILVTGRD